MGALCVHVDAQPCASNPERKGGKLRDKVQHNEPSLRAQYKPPRVSTVRVRDATGGWGGGAFVESWRDRGSVRVRSCQHQISPGELRPSALLPRPIYLTLFSCVHV